jgi:hypothetical protein
MNESKQEMMTVDLVYEAEGNAKVYREALLEMSLENDQLYNNYCELYDKLAQISARIGMANVGFSSPEIALAEIGDIIEVECLS